MSRFIPLVAALVAVPLAGCGPKANTDPTGTRPTVPAVPPIDIKMPPPDAPKPPTPPSDKEVAQKNLKQIGLAIHNYESSWGFLPVGVYKKGGVGLSWRVTILPFLDQENLFRQFKQDEPWDSEHNKKLIDQMPAVFASPGKKAEKGHTHLRAFTGPAAFIPTPTPTSGQPGHPIRGRAFVGIPDGVANTLFVAEAADPVVWTKPDELAYDGATPNDLKPLPKLGGVFPGGFHGVMGDGQVNWFPESMPEATLRALITVSGGEVVDLNAIKHPQGAPPAKKPPTDVHPNRYDAADHRTTVARLQALHAAAMLYHDANGHLPAGVIASKDAVGLSWRVQLLPYLGHENLYKQFRLAEPWDSEHNKKLLDPMPEVFLSGGAKLTAGHTYFRTTRGPQGVVFAPVLQPGQKPPPLAGEPGRPVPGRRLTDFADGLSLTILFAEGQTTVPWTKPDELELWPAPAAEQPKGGGIVKVVPPKLGRARPGEFHAVLADGTVVYYKPSLPAHDLAYLLTIAGGEPVEPLPAEHVEYAVPPKAKK